MEPYRRILCAIDFSPASIAALRHADDLASRLGATLTVLHVVADPLQQPWTAEAYGLNIADLEAEWIQRANAELSRLARGCQSKPVTMCRVGKPVAEILHCARTDSADLIVVGSHGHGVFAQMILGSVADRVLRQAPCPVLMVRNAPAGDLNAVATDQAEKSIAAAGGLQA
jgi:nucleotide-binding universal stress UspA family protein